MENKIKVSCNVCGGKGGWNNKKPDPYDSAWQDCYFCDGFGFYEKEPSETHNTFFGEYLGYKKRIIEALTDNICQVKNYTTENMGQTIEISIIPYNRGVFSDFVNYILKLGHYSSKLEIKVIQEFYYKPETNNYTHGWKLILEPNELSDLDGFYDIIKLWERKGR